MANFGAPRVHRIRSFIDELTEIDGKRSIVPHAR